MNYRLLCCINLIIFFSSNYEANASAANASINSTATQARTNSWENSNCIAHFENLTPDRIAILNRLIQNNTTPLSMDNLMTFEQLRYSDLIKEDSNSSQSIIYDIQNRKIHIFNNKYILFDDIQKIAADYFQVFLLRYGLQNSELSNLLEIFSTKINLRDRLFHNPSGGDTDNLDLNNAWESVIIDLNEPTKTRVLSNQDLYAFICYAHTVYKLHKIQHELHPSFQENNSLFSRVLTTIDNFHQNFISKFKTNNFSDFLKKIQNSFSTTIKGYIDATLTSPSFINFVKQKEGQDPIRSTEGIITRMVAEIQLIYFDQPFDCERSTLRNFIRRYINLLTNERP